MTPQEQNEAIAGACGKEYHKPTPEEIASGSYYQYEPNYVGDLNAMHEAENTLPCGGEHSPYERYVNLLREPCGDYGATSATAAQRAEAFLKVKGLWKE